MKKFISVLLACVLILTLAGCISTRSDTPISGSDIVSDADSVVDSNVGSQVDGKSFARRDSYESNVFEPIPTGYIGWYDDCGTVVNFNYSAKTEDGYEYEKHALVYLPKGYNAEDKNMRYNVVYLMHGSGDDETWYLVDSTRMTQTRRLFDSMVSSSDIAPCIVCTPTYNIPDYEPEDHTAAFVYEFKNYLMPALESEFNTYAKDTTPEGLKESRWNRAFVGFSAGSSLTWNIFDHCIDEVAYYIPVSGAYRGGFEGSESEKAAYLEQRIAEAGYTWEDFIIYTVDGGVDDLAYESVNEFVNALHEYPDTFKFCDDFSTGNIYYTSVDGGHAMYSVFNAMYNALPKFFG